MIAVLFNKGNIRLGEHRIFEGCRVIEFGGGIFAKTEVEVVLDDGGNGIAFDQTLIDVVVDLDKFAPRKSTEPRS